MQNCAAAAAAGRLGRLSAQVCPTSSSDTVVADELVTVLDAAQELLPKVTPELLVTQAGSSVKDASAWPSRRQELNDIIVSHEFGGMPPAPTQVDTTVMTDANIRQWQEWLPGVKHRILEAYVVLPTGGTLSLTIKLWIPPGAGPFPVLLDCDGCWRYFNDDVVRSVLERGNIAASYDRTQTAADNKDAYCNTGLYRHYPDADFMVTSAWAWGCHRAVDALLSQPEVRTDGITLTGHSRGGKCALLAGATVRGVCTVSFRLTNSIRLLNHPFHFIARYTRRLCLGLKLSVCSHVATMFLRTRGSQW
eukprot:COSAG02_NODE_6102_length_3795_cov_11.364989_4_plen_306_part_00